MQGFSLKTKLKKIAKIRLFSQLKNAVLGRALRLREKQIEKEALRLFDTPQKILVKRFFEIMETGKLSLLQKDRKKLKHHDLLKIWNDLLDYYYRNTSKKSWQKFLRDFKRKEELKAKILRANIALELIRYGSEDGLKELKSMGIPTNSLDNIMSGINRFQTSIEMIEAQQQAQEKGEAAKFIDLLVSLKMQLGRDVNLDTMTLEEWVATIKKISEKNEKERELIEKSKRK